MKSYNASKTRNSENWLALDETTRLDLIEDYVDKFEKEIGDEKKRIHATAHLIVENQLALNEEPTVDAYSRLMRQGLNRHETIHAIGAVVFEGIYSSLKGNDEVSINSYKNRLRKLTAKRWLKGKY